jgi:hypothetical protein
VMVAGLLKAPLMFLGTLCFFVGVLYVMARYFAVATVVVLEGQGPVAAFGRSSELSSGRKGHILVTLVLVWVIYIVLSIGVSTVAQLALNRVLQLVVASAFSIVAYPVIGLTEMLLYYDARIRGEGFDLELMAEALDASPTPGGAAP